jgi:hypothetical protein
MLVGAGVGAGEGAGVEAGVGAWALGCKVVGRKLPFRWVRKLSFKNGNNKI